MKHKIKRKRLPTIPHLIAKADTMCSLVVRRSAADRGGIVYCVTCHKPMHWTECDCGHFVKREVKQTRYDLRNLGPQCTRCNHFKNGEEGLFAQYIIHKYSTEVLDELIGYRGKPYKVTRVWLLAIIEQFKLTLEKLDAI